MAILAILACTRKYESSIPKDVIPEQEMEDLLIELYMLEASVRTCIITNQKDSLDIWITRQFNHILSKRKMDYLQFQHNYTYYMGHEDKSKELMENVVNRLVQQETKAIIQSQNARKQEVITVSDKQSEIKTITIKK